jgi:hypothetical protein
MGNEKRFAGDGSNAVALMPSTVMSSMRILYTLLSGDKTDYVVKHKKSEFGQFY